MMAPDLQKNIALFLLSGIPVVEMSGELSEAALGILRQTIDSLACAGHVDVIVNFARAIRPKAGDRNWLVRVEAVVASLKAHRGHIDIVGGSDLLEASAHWQSRSALRIASSEDEALCQIKGVRMTGYTPRMPAVLAA